MAFSKKLLICALAILTVALIASLFPVHGEAAIYDTVVRLHVVANSDSEEDQALKLDVRDAVVAVVTPAVKDCKTQAEAISKIEKIIPEIEESARAVVAQKGLSYKVSVVLGEEYYPTKNYESCAFPEGEYASLRVLIGEGEGQNWWCVMYPPLCVGAATDRRQATSLWSDSQQDLVKNGDRYVVKFKIVEWVQSLLAKIR